MPRRIEIVLVALGIMASGAVAACTVPIDGLTGVSVTHDGDLAIVVAWCERAPDGYTVFHDGPAGEDGSSVVDVSYAAPRLSGDHVVVDLLNPGNDWVARHTVPALTPAVEYSAYSWTADNSYGTQHVRFDLARTAKLEPGQVFYQDPNAADARHAGDTVVTVAEFTRRALAIC